MNSERNNTTIGAALLALSLAIGLWLLLASGAGRTQEGGTVSVAVEGLEGKLRENVDVYLEIQKLDGKPAPSESRLRYLFSAGEDEIRTALQPFGYYRPTIDATLTTTQTGWKATYAVDPGPDLRIAAVDVKLQGEGHDDPAFKRAVDNLPFASGEVLYQPDYEDFKTKLEGLAAERGYFNAHWLKSEIRLDLQAYNAAIILHYDTGQRYRFGQITFEKQALATALLDRYVKFEPGDPYLARDVLKLQSDLINSQYFSSVEVDASPSDAVGTTLPVNVLLEMAPKTKYSFGLGYGTDTGVRGKAEITRRWVNEWGHHYKIGLLASQIKGNLTGEYIIPGADPLTDQFSGRVGFNFENSDVKDSQTAIIGISQQQQDGLWLKLASLNYQWERFTFSDQRQTSGLLIPSLSWTRIEANDRLKVRNGTWLNLVVQGAWEPIISDTSFLQGIARGKWITSVGDRSRFILRGDLGTTLVSDFDKLPSSLRFFAGGESSVRGYKLDIIGPTDAQGSVVGGKHLVVASLEYDYRILDDWSVAAFADTGDAFNSGAPSLKTGVGIGVRWHSPVGPVRVDLASGLDRPPGSKIRLTFSIGPDL